MLKPAKIVSFMILIPTVLLGCVASLHTMPVGHAEPVPDWQGVNHVFRDGRVYFGGRPTAAALRDAPRRGITTVVNLRTASEMAGATGFDEGALVRELGMEYVSIPISGDTLSYLHADELKGVLDGTAGPVLIHCASSNRVGALWALYLHRHRGFDLGEAIDRGKQAGLNIPSLVEAVSHAAKANARR